MPMYELLSDTISELTPTTFTAQSIRERADLQRLLRERIDVVAPGVFVITEEFGEWTDSKRRIDLLALDSDANLVVIELKRTEDGGHMDLQAIRYAAMVSAMTFDQVVTAHAAYLAKIGENLDARQRILDFLEWKEPNDPEFAQNVRIVLVSEGFSKEITTAVMWLNQRGLDLRCVRLTPYVLDGRVLIDAQQTIPLPEAAEYQVQIRNKAQQERVVREGQRDYTKFDVTVGAVKHSNLSKRDAIYRVVRTLCDAGITPEQIAGHLSTKLSSKTKRWYEVEGEHSQPEEFIARATEDAAHLGRTFDESRWCLRPSELLVISGRTYAFSNQWGVGTAEIMDSLLSSFPIADVKIEARTSA